MRAVELVGDKRETVNMDSVGFPVGVAIMLHRTYGSVAARPPAGCETTSKNQGADKGIALQWDKGDIARYPSRMQDIV